MQFGKLGGGHWRFLTFLTWRSPGLELNDQGYLRQADQAQQVIWIQYRKWEPFFIFRTFNVNWNQWTFWDFKPSMLNMGGNMNLNFQLKNYWSAGFGINRGGENLNRSELRGGPAMLFPGDWNNWLFVATDQRKKLGAELSMFNNWGDINHSRFLSLSLEVSYRVSPALEVSLEPEYNSQRRDLQYVTTLQTDLGTRYILSTLNADILNANLRVNLSLTPDFSLQFWGQPFLFAGEYTNYKRVTLPQAEYYHDRFHQFTEQEISYNSENNEYYVDENNDGETDYSFAKPDFNFFEFHSNLVARWEYLPGSVLYLVWSQNRDDYTEQGIFAPGNDMKTLFGGAPENIFLIKASFRIGL